MISRNTAALLGVIFPKIPFHPKIYKYDGEEIFIEFGECEMQFENSSFLLEITFMKLNLFRQFLRVCKPMEMRMKSFT